MRKINKIVIHHSLTPRDLDLTKSLTSFNRTHKHNLHDRYGQTVSDSVYRHIAYHFVIGGNGEVQACRNLKDVGYHASNRKVNEESIGICFTGNFDKEHPTEAQYEQGRQLIQNLEGMFGSLEVHRHSEYAKKTCPGTNFDINKLNSFVMNENERRAYKNKQIEAIANALSVLWGLSIENKEKDRVGAIKKEIIEMNE